MNTYSRLLRMVSIQMAKDQIKAEAKNNEKREYL
jgi:hypothetical protein